jgi:hypothetical protein
VLVPLLVTPLAGCSTGAKRAGWTPILPPGPGATASPTPNGLEAARADEVFGRIHRAFDDSPSVHATGELTGDGDTVRLDVHLEAGGAQGTFVSVNFGRVTEIVIGETVYLSGDEPFLRSLGGEELAARGRGGAWLTGTLHGDNSAGDLVELPLLSKADYLALLDSPRLYPLGDTHTAGVPARTFTNDDGLRMLVPLAGEPRLMRAWRQDGAAHLDVHFEYGPGWKLRAPGRAAVV